MEPIAAASMSLAKIPPSGQTLATEKPLWTLYLSNDSPEDLTLTFDLI